MWIFATVWLSSTFSESNVYPLNVSLAKNVTTAKEVEVDCLVLKGYDTKLKIIVICYTV